MEIMNCKQLLSVLQNQSEPCNNDHIPVTMSPNHETKDIDMDNTEMIQQFLHKEKKWLESTKQKKKHKKQHNPIQIQSTCDTSIFDRITHLSNKVTQMSQQLQPNDTNAQSRIDELKHRLNEIKQTSDEYFLDDIYSIPITSVHSKF